MDFFIEVIYASDVSRGPPISTFGWSLSGGMDMDNNLYPDLLVGAYLSNTAILLKWGPETFTEVEFLNLNSFRGQPIKFSWNWVVFGDCSFLGISNEIEEMSVPSNDFYFAFIYL